MSFLLKNIARMQIMLAEMEVEAGIREMGSIEKSVLSAIADLDDGKRLVRAKDILRHPLTDIYSRPSLFRTMKNLEKLGKIAKSTEQRGVYFLVA